MAGTFRFSRLAIVALWLASAAPALGGGIYWGVDVFDTPNLPGFKTYDLTLKTIGGAPSVVSFDSALGGGISGPLNQSARRPGGKSQLFGGGSDPSNLADSRFLFTPGDGHLTIGNLVDSDSLLSMTWGAFNYAIDPTTREMPFARLVTNDPASVRLNGSVHTFQGGGSSGGAYPIDFTLDRVFDFTSPPPPPVIPVVPVIPVAYDSPPVVVTPEVPSPVVVTPPVFVAPASPPGPVSGAIYWGVNSFETPGLPGFTTYEVTMKSAAGAIVSMAFDPAIRGGISGPLHQAPGDSVIFEGGDDAGNLADSRFLLTPTEANLVFNSGESASAMQTVFGTYGDRLDPSAVEVPFARFVTDRPNDVLISGNVGTVLPWGVTMDHAIDLSLNDMLALTSPLEIPNDPYAPPPPPPAPVVRPPVVEAPPVNEPYFSDPFIETTYSAPPPTPNPVYEAVAAEINRQLEAGLPPESFSMEDVQLPPGYTAIRVPSSVEGQLDGWVIQSSNDETPIGSIRTPSVGNPASLVSPGYPTGTIDFVIDVGDAQSGERTPATYYEEFWIDGGILPGEDWPLNFVVGGVWQANNWACDDVETALDAHPTLAIDADDEAYAYYLNSTDGLVYRGMSFMTYGASVAIVPALGTASAGLSVVPEPGAATLALVAMAGVRRRGRR